MGKNMGFEIPIAFDKVLEEGEFFNRDKSTLVLGRASIGTPWKIYLNLKAMKKYNRTYDVIGHENAHCDLLTSTAFGHVQQFIFNVSKLFREISIKSSETSIFICYYKHLFEIGKVLNKLSWNVHEGAAVSYGLIWR